MGVPCNSSEDMGWPATKEALLHQPCNGFTPGLSTCKGCKGYEQAPTNQLFGSPLRIYVLLTLYSLGDHFERKKKLFERVEGHGKHQHHAGDAQLCYNIDLFPLLT